LLVNLILLEAIIYSYWLLQLILALNLLLDFYIHTYTQFTFIHNQFYLIKLVKINSFRRITKHILRPFMAIIEVSYKICDIIHLLYHLFHLRT